MKILYNTPERLIVEHKPVWIAVFITLFSLIFIAVGLLMTRETLFGLVFVGVGLFFGVVFSLVFVKRTQVIFDRTAQTVELRRKSLQRYTRRDWDLRHFERAMVQSTTSDEGTKMYRPTLVFSGGMDAGKHPIVSSYQSGKGAQRLVDAINGWHSTAP